ncbi:MAG TPA: hypothetical protein VED41_13070 [Solirubrobacteraceae bacterium]|nr:hypothetical protein [Solirubrobacteraceae bacterium]
MTVVALLPVLVFVAGLLVYLFCVGISKSSAAEIGKIMFFAGLLAFLIGSGAQSCQMSAGGGGSAQHR